MITSTISTNSRPPVGSLYIVHYDGVGNGSLMHLPGKNGDTSFWTVELFVDDLQNLVQALGIQDNFDLFGHPFGGMLASTFAMRQPKGLRRLVLASSIASFKDHMEAALKLLAELLQ